MKENIAAQVAELTPEQKENILRAGKKVRTFHWIDMLLSFILAIGFFGMLFVMDYIDSQQPTLAEIEKHRLTYEKNQAKCNRLAKTIEYAEEERTAANLELTRLQQPNISFVDGEVVTSEPTDAQRKRIDELNKKIATLDADILTRLTEKQRAETEAFEAKAAYDEAYNEYFDEEKEQNRSNLIKGYFIVMIVFFVAGTLCSIIISTVTIKKYPYYSDKKWKYIKKNG